MTHADGSRVEITDLKKIDERLDLWAGSRPVLEVDGVPVRVETAVHPTHGEVAVRIDSPLIASGRLKVRIAFPYAFALVWPGVPGLDAAGRAYDGDDAAGKYGCGVRPRASLFSKRRGLTVRTKASEAELRFLHLLNREGRTSIAVRSHEFFEGRRPPASTRLLSAGARCTLDPDPRPDP